MSEFNAGGMTSIPRLPLSSAGYLDIMIRHPSLTSVTYSLALVFHMMLFVNLIYYVPSSHLFIHDHRPKCV